ncbi:hypothetical protein C8R44DRAFT_56418 [Mycena epipterygia]|nr:hypothetical protein C8R44DRAFT_56418 [Mycena epipterygia]
MSPCLSICVYTLAFVAATAALSNVQAPSSPAADANVTVTWSSDSSDTTPVTLALFSADSNQTFAGGLAIASNVNPQANQATFIFPQVVAGYVRVFSPASYPSIISTHHLPSNSTLLLFQPSYICLSVTSFHHHFGACHALFRLFRVHCYSCASYRSTPDSTSPTLVHLISPLT